MPDVAQSKLSGHADALLGTKGSAQGFGDIHHRRCHPRSDIDDTVQGNPGLDGLGEGSGDIRNMDKIAAFKPIFKNWQIETTPNARGKDRQYTRVGIVERLPFPINVLKTKDGISHAGAFANDTDKIFLRELRCRIDGSWRRTIILARGNSSQHRPRIRAYRLPLPRTHRFSRSGGWRYARYTSPVRIYVGSLAIYRAR